MSDLFQTQNEVTQDDHAASAQNLVTSVVKPVSWQGFHTVTRHIKVATNLIFAPIHTARKVTKWFGDNGIDVLEWPPYSPDSNPIEHLWFRLKKLVYTVRPDIEQVSGDVHKVRDVLYEALDLAWTMIKGHEFEGLVRSMERKVAAVIAAEGWYTRY